MTLLMTDLLYKMEKISIITPSLNQAKFLEETILSVKNQGYPNYEHIILDGGSTDGTIEILEKYHNDIRFISEKDAGQTDAINRGLIMADGDILAFINSDDFYLPGTFHKVARAFHDSEAFWVVGDYKIVDYQGQNIQHFVTKYKKFLRENALKTTIPLANSIPQPSTFWKRTVLDKVGFLNISYKYAFDYEYWLRIIEWTTPFLIKEPLSAFRIHTQSKGSQDYIQQMDEEILILQAQKTTKIIRRLHQVNNSLIKFIYRRIK
jgi:glycosyltransferase involved in cell wall biosynthesis